MSMGGVWLPRTEHRYMSVLDHGPRAETKGIVIHVNEGTFNGTLNWFSGGSYGVGAHFEIGKLRAVQLVPADHVCWHAVDANASMIGIEHVGWHDWSRWRWLLGREIGMSACRAAWLCHQFNLGAPHFGRNVFPHSHGGAAWGGHQDCPGPNFPWDVWLRRSRDAYYSHWGR